MRRKHERTNDRKHNGWKVTVLILLMIVILSAVFLCLGSCTDISIFDGEITLPVYLEDDGESIEGEAETADREEILDSLEKQQLVVTDKLSSNITFESGTEGSIGEWVVENPEENTVIMQAEVYLDETMIAKSTPIYPNQHITAVSLLSETERGEYEVTAYINYYDLETKEFISKAGYKIHLTVN